MLVTKMIIEFLIYFQKFYNDLGKDKIQDNFIFNLAQ
jgi:hypothetical protein